MRCQKISILTMLMGNGFLLNLVDFYPLQILKIKNVKSSHGFTKRPVK